MTTRRGKKVQESLRGERFTKSVIRVKLSPAEMVRILREKNELRNGPRPWCVLFESIPPCCSFQVGT